MSDPTSEHGRLVARKGRKRVVLLGFVKEYRRTLSRGSLGIPVRRKVYRDLLVVGASIFICDFCGSFAALTSQWLMYKKGPP